MQTILTAFATRSLRRQLADCDAHQLRDIGLVRAADGSLRLLNDPSVEAAPTARQAKQARSWGRRLGDFLTSSQRLKTAR